MCNGAAFQIVQHFVNRRYKTKTETGELHPNIYLFIYAKLDGDAAKWITYGVKGGNCFEIWLGGHHRSGQVFEVR
jgi:hypothetical protein